MTSTLELFQQYPHLEPEKQKEIDDHILEMMQTAEYINELMGILANFEIDNSIRRRTAVLFARMINIHYDVYNVMPQIFDPLMPALLNETDPYIGDQISYGFQSIMNTNGEEWTQLVELITQMCTNDNLNTFWIGTKFLINFIPGVRNEFLLQMMEMILPLFLKLLSNEQCFYDGFRLFATIQMQPDFVATEMNAPLTEIFNRMLEIYAAALVDESKENESLRFAKELTKSLKNETPFTSPASILEKLVEIAGNEQIDTSRKHIPLYPIAKLIKYHGKELKEAIPTVINAIFTISSSQFHDGDYEDEEASRTAIDLFGNIAKAANSANLFELLTSNLYPEADFPQSFVSLCAIYGTIDELLEQYEQNIDSIITYIFSKITLESVAIIEICLKILAELAEALSDAMKPYVASMFEAAFQFIAFPNLEIPTDAINIISTVFDYIDLEPSFIIPHFSNLLELVSSASDELKPSIMGAIASGILACQDAIEPFTEAIVQIIQAGIASENPIFIQCSMEIFGNLVYSANNIPPEFIAQGIEIVSNYSQDDDYSLRVCSLYAFKMIADKTNGPVPNAQPEFWTFLLMTAINAVGQQDDGTTKDHSDYKEDDVRESGSALLKSMLKHHPEECVASGLTQSLPIHFSIFIDFEEDAVALKNIQASIYYLLNIAPQDQEILNLYLNIITKNKNTSKVAAVFKAFLKLLNRDQDLAKANANLTQFLQCCLNALSRELRCQVSKCVDEEERFNFDPEFMSSIYSIICASFKIDPQIIPPDTFIPNFAALLGKVGNMEALEILGTMGDYVLAGGTVTQEIMEFAFGQIQEIDYSKAPDAIFLIRAMIKMHPELMASTIEQLLPFFKTQLEAEESSQKYYWGTITNVISAVFDLAQSEQLGQVINLGDVMPLILTKLPVKGDYEEAQFIYNSLISFYQANQDKLVEHIEPAFSALVQTFALKPKTFDKYELTSETILQLAQIIDLILKNKEEYMQAIPGILDQDEIRVSRFQERFGSLHSAAE